MSSPLKERSLGLVWATTAISIWSGSLVMLRLGVTTSLNAYDLTALRVGVAALLLAPVIYKRGLTPGDNGVGGALTMAVCFGAPYILLISLGLKTAPASAAGSLNPGIMAIVSVLLGWKIFGDKMGPVRILGVGVILIGISFFSGFLSTGMPSTGHFILIFTGVMWASYALIARQSGIPALHATAIVAVGSAILYLPIYAVALPKQLADAPTADIVMQAVFQGILVSVVAVFAFNRSAEQLGPITGATLPALIPVVTLGLGAVVLAEKVDTIGIISSVLISAGVAMTLSRSDKK
ncbi:DMT family transporter [Halomonas sp. SpR1]|uniref:DMT family transporter n=1 Tax=Halomonas sp. SpR1 TaxID=3050462 RepID=UPI0027E47933|nr:DMT family transporter [Halomonas sp. SpR1]MDQ7733125.1 DMT family transporter [Halomonas sp. SpR1]